MDVISGDFYKLSDITFYIQSSLRGIVQTICGKFSIIMMFGGGGGGGGVKSLTLSLIFYIAKALEDNFLSS